MYSKMFPDFYCPWFGNGQIVAYERVTDDLIVVKATYERFFILGKYGFWGHIGDSELRKGKFSNRTMELTSDLQQKIITAYNKMQFWPEDQIRKPECRNAVYGFDANGNPKPNNYVTPRHKGKSK